MRAIWLFLVCSYILVSRVLFWFLFVYIFPSLWFCSLQWTCHGGMWVHLKKAALFTRLHVQNLLEVHGAYKIAKIIIINKFDIVVCTKKIIVIAKALVVESIIMEIMCRNSRERHRKCVLIVNIWNETPKVQNGNAAKLQEIISNLFDNVFCWFKTLKNNFLLSFGPFLFKTTNIVYLQIYIHSHWKITFEL